MKQSTIWTIVAIVVAIVGFSLLGLTSKKVDTKARTNREVALLCTTDMATKYHIHPKVTIMINGERQVIPTNIGIRPTCMNSLHTHDATGMLHVESPEVRDFTLDDFFAVWGKTYTKEQILDSKVDAATEITQTVNGVKVDTFENTILHDKDEIVISFEKKK